MPNRRKSDAAPKRDPIQEAIALRAYELFLQRGANTARRLKIGLKPNANWSGLRAPRAVPTKRKGAEESRAVMKRRLHVVRFASVLAFNPPCLKTRGPV